MYKYIYIYIDMCVYVCLCECVYVHCMFFVNVNSCAYILLWEYDVVILDTAIKPNFLIFFIYNVMCKRIN